MIKIENNSDLVFLVNEQPNKILIKLNKDITISSKEKLKKIETGITIDCDNEIDEVFVIDKSNRDEDYSVIGYERFDLNSDDNKLNLTIFNHSNKSIKIPMLTVLARIFLEFKQNIGSKDDYSMPIVYNTDGIIIKSNNKITSVDSEINDNEKLLKIKISNE